MTTNHLERLDPALIRPGRVDLICELGDAEPAQVRELLVRFYRTDMLEERVNEARKARGINPAEFDDVTGPPPDAQTDYYVCAASETNAELDRLSMRLQELVAEVTLRRRRVLQLNETGHREGSASGALPHWPKAAARGGVSMAELQGLFIRFADDPHGAVAAFEHENT